MKGGCGNTRNTECALESKRKGDEGECIYVTSKITKGRMTRKYMSQLVPQ
jgi:hypothetical protein